MIRVLQVVPSLNINSGMMSVVMNYYREIDRSKIQFDFLYFGEMAESHQKEIETLGGRTFYMKRPTFKPQDQRRLNAFFENHKGEYIAVHCHPIWVSAVVAHAAKKAEYIILFNMRILPNILKKGLALLGIVSLSNLSRFLQQIILRVMMKQHDF